MDIGKRKKDLSEERLLYRGVLFRTYIIFEGRDFILLIDQHAAHERVLYEKFKESSKNINSVKTLLIPINFTPPRKKYADLLESIDVFKEAGIEIEPFGDESFNILTIPGVIPESREDELLSYLFDEFYEGKINLQAHEIKERFLKLASCRSAIKEGNTINEEEARTLLNDLRSVKIPYVCPHGRPTFVRISKEYFEKAFKRR
ncbi:DNA mismatch repair protein MutL [subsurface metagenome]